MLTLFTDTDTDFTPDVAKEYGYRLISMPYSIDGKTIWPYEDFEVFDSHAFYDGLRNGVLPRPAASRRSAISITSARNSNRATISSTYISPPR